MLIVSFLSQSLSKNVDQKRLEVHAEVGAVVACVQIVENAACALRRTRERTKGTVLRVRHRWQ